MNRLVPVKINLNNVLPGLPKSITKTRKALIYKPPKPATQSGLAQTRLIKVEFKRDDTTKWASRPLEWTSSEDPMQGLVLQFSNVQDAIGYCNDHGLEYTLLPDTAEDKEITPKLYADNFKYSSGKLKLIRTK